MSDRRRRPDERSVDCDECRKGSPTVAPKFNKARGRYCFKFSEPEVRSGLIQIEWDGKKETGKNRASLLRAYQLMQSWQDSEGAPKDFESVMKGIGMCVWSWPFSRQEVDAYSSCALSQAGMGIQYPEPMLGADDQPNLWWEFFSLYTKAKADYAEAHPNGEVS